MVFVSGMGTDGDTGAEGYMVRRNQTMATCAKTITTNDAMAIPTIV